MDFSDISIINLLPPNLAKDKNVRMMCEAFDEELRRIIADIPGIAIIPNLVLKKITDSLLLDLLAWQFHCDFYSTDLPIEKKQEIIMKALDWHTRKGTPAVIEEIVSTVFSKAEIQEWFEYGGLPYRFRIGTEEEMPDEETRAKLIRAINSVKNVRSGLEKITSLIVFEDEVEVADSLTMVVKFLPFEERYPRLLFNGAAKFDGNTQNDSIYGTEMVPVGGKFNGRFLFDGTLPFGESKKFNGDCKYDGSISFNGISPGSKLGKIKNPDRLVPPFKFRSWITDSLVIKLSGDGLEFEDYLATGLYFDGSAKFGGKARFDNVGLYSVNDPFAGKAVRKFNGSAKFDGKYQYDGTYGGETKIKYADNVMNEAIQTSEEILITVRRHHYFNGAYRFNGIIKFDGVPSVLVA